MTTQNDEVSRLVNQAFDLQLQLTELKKQIFRVADGLHMLYGSYEGLQVITADCSGDPNHVCAVLYGLNYRFEDLLKQLDPLYKRDEETPKPTA